MAEKETRADAAESSLAQHTLPDGGGAQVRGGQGGEGEAGGSLRGAGNVDEAETAATWQVPTRDYFDRGNDVESGRNSRNELEPVWADDSSENAVGTATPPMLLSFALEPTSTHGALTPAPTVATSDGGAVEPVAASDLASPPTLASVRDDRPRTPSCGGLPPHPLPPSPSPLSPPVAPAVSPPAPAPAASGVKKPMEPLDTSSAARALLPELYPEEYLVRAQSHRHSHLFPFDALIVDHMLSHTCVPLCSASTVSFR
jgi:hypothetical protein